MQFPYVTLHVIGKLETDQPSRYFGSKRKVNRQHVIYKDNTGKEYSIVIEFDIDQTAIIAKYGYIDYIIENQRQVY